MKKINLIKYTICVLLFFSSITLLAQSNEWMTSLDLAKVLARTQNKMILMVWEESTEYPLPIAAKDENGKLVYIEDLFEASELNDLLWNYFIPVKVDEAMYSDLFSEIEGKRSLRYINMFQDDSLKIMDANGNLLLVSGVTSTAFLYLDKFINKYALSTKFLSKELNAYATKKDFFSTYYLASKYIDYCVFLNKDIRKQIMALSTIYIDEANRILTTLNNENKLSLKQQLDLLPLKQDLVLGKAKKMLRMLGKLDQSQFNESTNAEVAFLYYTAYKILDNKKGVDAWQSKVSSVNLENAERIVNINK